MRRSGAWMQLCLKLGARAMRLARPSFIARFGYFFRCLRILQIGAIGKALDAIYQAFFWPRSACDLDQSALGRRSMFNSTERGPYSGPRCLWRQALSNYRSLGVQRRAE